MTSCSFASIQGGGVSNNESANPVLICKMLIVRRHSRVLLSDSVTIVVSYVGSQTFDFTKIGDSWEMSTVVSSGSKYNSRAATPRPKSAVIVTRLYRFVLLGIALKVTLPFEATVTELVVVPG